MASQDQVRFQEQLNELVRDGKLSMSEFTRIQGDMNKMTNEQVKATRTLVAELARTNKESLGKLTEWSQNTSRLEREEIKSFLMYSSSIFRQAFMKNIGLDQYVNFQSSSNFNFEGFSKYINANNIENISNLVEDCHHNIKRNANSKMVMTSLAFELTKLIHT